LVNIAEKIHYTHHNFDLEVLIKKIIENIPGVKEVRQEHGRSDKGADIIFDFEYGLPIPGLQYQGKCVVQVKSFEGPHWDTTAAEDIKRAFDNYPEAEMGLVISTATTSTEALDNALDKIREETGKTVSLLIGADVAVLFLRYGGQLLEDNF